MTDAEAWGRKTHDDLARAVLASAIERRHFSGAPLAQFAVDLLRHCLTAIEDRAALVDMTATLFDSRVDAARRHMRGEEGKTP